MDKDERAKAVLWPQTTGREETALLVGLQLPLRDKEQIEDSLEELRQLALTAGVSVARIEVTKRQSRDPAFYIGSGKAEEIAGICRTQAINVVIFDDDLAPAQVKNLQNLFGVKVIDRTELILDIFARQAHSREGKIQVELAQLQYMLPRLVHAWTHLSRQWSGVGTRGPGERQLEIDRRRIREQIIKHKQDLVTVGGHRHERRKKRERAGVPLVSILGYTNAGKTTVFNNLTVSRLPVADKLFTTLDTKIKKIILPNNQPVLFSDTVGFIRKLPHHLVESFKATLEEVKEADILLQVIDGSARYSEQQFDIAVSILKELGAADKPMIAAVNKIDLLAGPEAANRLCRKFPVSIPISAKTGAGLEQLLANIQSALERIRERVEMFIPNTNQGLLSKIYGAGNVIKIEYTAKGARVTAELPPPLIGELGEWIKR